jgi:hypothetical protein
MDYAITTYGGGEVLEGLFNAIAVCLNSTDGTLFTPLVRFGLLLGGFMGLVYAFWGDQLGFVKNWLIPFVKPPVIEPSDKLEYITNG